MSDISIVISNWNGKELLEEYLPSVMDACRAYKGSVEIIVSDDHSKDMSVEFLRKFYPEVKIVLSEKHMGFSSTCNRGIFRTQNKIVVLLNNDMRVDRNFLTLLPQHFDDKNTFAVRLAIKPINGKVNYNIEDVRDKCKFKMGLLYLSGFIAEGKKDKNSHQFFSAAGGACAFDREKFIELGGFDELFNPFYWEDVDLSFRARKRGWEIIYEPKSVIYHQGQATNSRYTPFQRSVLSEKNRYYFIWKNITDKKLIIKHILWIPIRVMGSLFELKLYVIPSLLIALAHLSEVLNKRKGEKRAAIVPDREIFKQFEVKNEDKAI